MSRPSALPLRLLILFFAAVAVLALSRLPWERLQQTYTLLPTLAAKNTGEGEIYLSGMQWPRVGVAIVRYEGGMYVRVILQEKETEDSEPTSLSQAEFIPSLPAGRSLGGDWSKDGPREITLTVPASWELQEVRGLHARKLLPTPENRHHYHITLYGSTDSAMDESAQRTTTTPSMLFRTAASFPSLRFAHNSPFPALFTVSHATFPEREMRRMTFFVKDMRVIEL